MHYSKKRRETVLKKMMPPNNKSIPQISQEEGIPESTLYTWRTKAKKAGVLLPAGSNTPAGWSSKDKFLAVLETASLSEAEISIYCRKKGLYPEQIQDWKTACEKANDWDKHSSQQFEHAVKEERQKNKQLARELYRKEKALAETAALLVLRKKAVLKEQCSSQPLVLHSDNGSPMKGATFLETLRRLEIQPSYSRPRVSNDNPFSESLFKTCKYRPEYTGKGFQALSSTRNWGLSFVTWYNTQHRHSKINFVTPQQRHDGRDTAILAKRTMVFKKAQKRHPERWSGSIRKWEVQTEVWLNPDRSENEKLVENAA